MAGQVISGKSDYRSRIQRPMSSWLPRIITTSWFPDSTKPKRNANPARHSKAFPFSLRIPSPLWTWGFPNASPISSSASRAPILSSSGRARSCFWTAGAKTTDFFKGFLQFVRDRNQLALSAKPLDLRVYTSDEAIEFVLARAVLPPGIIVRLHLHFAQGDETCSRNNRDLLAACRRIQPLAQILLRVGDGEGLHIDHTTSFCGLYQAAIRT